jgi:serine protease Do
VSIQSVNDDLAKSFGLDHARGALVAEVVANSPAAKAGIRPGDIILSYNGQDIATSSTLPALVGDTKVGKTVPLTVWRDGKTVSLQATIAVMSEKNTVAAKAHAHKTDVLHMRVADLTDRQRRDFAVGKRGILVKEVEDGPAADAGIHQGDVILQLDHKDIASVAEFAAVEAKLPRDKPFSVLIQRQGSPLFLAATVPK